MCEFDGTAGLVTESGAKHRLVTGSEKKKVTMYRFVSNPEHDRVWVPIVPID